MIYIYCALYAEAKPVIQYFKLKKTQSRSGLEIFENEEEQIRLLLTGTGPLAAAVAVSRTMEHFGAGEGDILINWGSCAGEAENEIGNVYLANQLTDSIFERTYYPDMLWGSSIPEAEVITGATVWQAQLSKISKEQGCFSRSNYDREKDSMTGRWEYKKKSSTEERVFDVKSDFVADRRDDKEKRSITERVRDVKSLSVADRRDDIVNGSIAERAWDVKSLSMAERRDDKEKRSIAEKAWDVKGDFVAEKEEEKEQGKEECARGEKVVLHDMEAAAIYYAGSFFLAPHQMRFLKVISDHGDRTVSADELAQTMEEAFPVLLKEIQFHQEIQKQSVKEQADSFDGRESLELLFEEFHCSETMKAALRGYVSYWKLAGIDYQKEIKKMREAGELPCQDRREGKKRLEQIKSSLL